MSDLSTRLRQAATVYDASYPPGVYAPDPHINTLTPNTVSAAAGPTTVTVAGTDFEATSVVEIAGTAQATTFVSPASLTVSYDPTVAATVQFTVRNTSGKESNSVPFVVGALSADDVSAMTVEETKEFVMTNPGSAGTVEDLERQGKARSGLLTWFEGLPDRVASEVYDPETYPEDPEPDQPEPSPLPGRQPGQPEPAPQPGPQPGPQPQPQPGPEG